MWWQRRRDPVADQRWVVLDVESSGLDPARDRLLAIAAVAVQTADERPWIDCADSFEVVLRRAGEGPPPDKANILVHGLGVGEQGRGVEPADALRAFERYVGDSPLLGFHVGFDRKLIERAFDATLGRRLQRRWLDLEPLAALTHPEANARALDDWLAHFGIVCSVRHQAAADALATAELLLRLWPALRRERATEFEACVRLAAQRRWVA
ncbi:MAG TPA: 3'-5' exonuclease [Rubrivivax sp.]